MACIVPNVLPRSASAGERHMHGLLQRLPEDCVVYYEPMVSNLCPDFVVICPELGVLVIEVKGWRSGDIAGADDHTVQITEHGRVVRKVHPLRQAREYMFALMKRCQAHPAIGPLLRAEGFFENRFLFPFGHVAVLSNLTEARLRNHPAGDLTAVFPPDRVLPSDVLLALKDRKDGAELLETLRRCFVKSWPFPRLTQEQVDALRAIIHPEIILELPLQYFPGPASAVAETPGAYATRRVPPKAPAASVRVLDVRQENHARALGDGHRILSGVAGSGKTVILIARAKLLAQRDPAARILVLCYNVALASFLRGKLRDSGNVSVCHFHGWAAANHVHGNWKAQDADQALGEDFLAALERGDCPDARHFDSILIDEAQDFESSWFRCVLAALKDPAQSDLLIVGDGNQGVYRRGKISWLALGIQARGRTISSRFDLDINYRNSREIAALSQVFASQASADRRADEDTIGAVAPMASKCPRAAGRKPKLFQEPDRRGECARAVSIVQDLLEERLRPEEIGVLYRRRSKGDEALFADFLRDLERVAPVRWLNARDDPKARECVDAPGVKVQTIHSAKGLQYRAVILLWADDLPYLPPRSVCDEADERRLFYVGLTRAEDFLALTAPLKPRSPFIGDAIESGHLLISESRPRCTDWREAGKVYEAMMPSLR